MMKIEDMTHEQRQAEIEHIKTEHRDILSTPMIMEGNIDPDAISAMSDRKKKAWGKASEAKLGLQATMHALSATDAEIAERRLSRARDKVADMEDRASNHIRCYQGLGRMAYKKNGDMKIGYKRAILHDMENITKAKAELAEVEKSNGLYPDNAAGTAKGTEDHANNNRRRRRARHSNLLT